MQGQISNAYHVSDRETEGKGHLRDLDVDGRIILKLILKR